MKAWIGEEVDVPIVTNESRAIALELAAAILESLEGERTGRFRYTLLPQGERHAMQVARKTLLRQAERMRG